MKYEEFDEAMSHAKTHTPNEIRLSSRLVEKLKTLAELEGEPEYQAMVQRWLRERLQKRREAYLHYLTESLALASGRNQPLTADRKE
jgi:hypothetical protein